MNRSTFLIAFFILNQIGAQYFLEIELNEKTITTGKVMLRTEPRQDAPLVCWVGRRQKVDVIKYSTLSDMWLIRTKKCQGYIFEFAIEVTKSMEKHKMSMDSLAVATQKEKNLIAQIKENAFRDSIRAKKEAQQKSRKIYSNSNSTPQYYSSRKYYTGPRGGCYYINTNGNKTYVDSSMCN